MNQDKHDHAAGPQDGRREDELLMSLWKADAMAFNPAPVSSKTKKALQDMLRRHGVTHMPAIDALEVYEGPEDISVSKPQVKGRLALFQLLGAMRDRVAVAVSEVGAFLDAMSRPLPMATGSAMRLQRDAEPHTRNAEHTAANLAPAHDWHIKAVDFIPTSRLVYLDLRTHRPGDGPVHVAVLGWSSAALTRLRAASSPQETWVPEPEDVLCLWEGDLDGRQEQHLVAVNMPEGCALAAGSGITNTALVDDGAGAWIANLPLAQMKV